MRRRQSSLSTHSQSSTHSRPAVVVTVAAVAVNVKLPPLLIVPVKVKFKTDLPPKASGLGSAWPNELTMM